MASGRKKKTRARKKRTTSIMGSRGNTADYIRSAHHEAAATSNPPTLLRTDTSRLLSRDGTSDAAEKRPRIKRARINVCTHMYRCAYTYIRSVHSNIYIYIRINTRRMSARFRMSHQLIMRIREKFYKTVCRNYIAQFK